MRPPDYSGKRWRLYVGDCLETMRGMEAGSVDAVVTDPPYGIGGVWKGGRGHGWGFVSDEAPVRNEWDATTPKPETWDELQRVGRKVIVWGGNYFPLPPSRGWLLWVKPERGFTLAEAEMAWTNVDAVIRCFDAPRHIADRQHPTQKPVELMQWCLRWLKLPKDAVIFDPFCGSGSTGVAALSLGYRFIGCELSPEYAAIAARRIGSAPLPLDFDAPEPTAPTPKDAPVLGDLFHETESETR